MAEKRQKCSLIIGQFCLKSGSKSYAAVGLLLTVIAAYDLHYFRTHQAIERPLHLFMEASACTMYPHLFIQAFPIICHSSASTNDYREHQQCIISSFLLFIHLICLSCHVTPARKSALPERTDVGVQIQISLCRAAGFCSCFSDSFLITLWDRTHYFLKDYVF